MLATPVPPPSPLMATTATATAPNRCDLTFSGLQSYLADAHATPPQAFGTAGRIVYRTT